MHRDIKGANILVDNKGCIKLAYFGASKEVVELATISGAKSMKVRPYWMAPEVILQTSCSFSADIRSVGYTVIEMATGKPPWSQQYQEVAALFHTRTTKSHTPIPEHLSFEAKDFLLKCLQKEPNLRPVVSELLQEDSEVPISHLHQKQNKMEWTWKLILLLAALEPLERKKKIFLFLAEHHLQRRRMKLVNQNLRVHMSKGNAIVLLFHFSRPFYLICDSTHRSMSFSERERGSGKKSMREKER